MECRSISLRWNIVSRIWRVNFFDELNFSNFTFINRFGHQDKVLGIDSLSKERCITCGARDRSLRLWKIPEESQLVFNAVH